MWQNKDFKTLSNIRVSLVLFCLAILFGFFEILKPPEMTLAFWLIWLIVIVSLVSSFFIYSSGHLHSRLKIIMLLGPLATTGELIYEVVMKIVEPENGYPLHPIAGSIYFSDLALVFVVISLVLALAIELKLLYGEEKS